jgi:hypothetical protein
MNNNDKYKKFIREHRSEIASFSALSGTELACANRSVLEELITDAGFDLHTALQSIAQPAPARPAPAQPAPVAQPAPAPVAQPAGGVDQAIEALRLAMASAQPKETTLSASQLATLKADLLAELTPAPVTVNITENKAIIKKIDKAHKCFPDLLMLAKNRIHVMLVGPAGSFKTTGAEQAAEALGLEYSAISVCQQTTATAFLGYMNAVGSYVSTEFRKRYENGGVFLLDEVDAGNSNVLAVLNSALANGSCAFPDGMTTKHKDFVLIASGNTFGTGANASYVGRCQLDAATLDRFAVLDWDYDNDLELALASDTRWAKRVQSLRNAANELNSKCVISPRATFSGQKLLADGMLQSSVEQMLIWKGMKPSERAKIEAKAA